MPGHLRMGRRLAALAIGATAAVALAACSSGGGTATTSSPTASSAATGDAIKAVAKCDSGADESAQLKLGAFLPLTGGLAFLGPASVGGVDLALSDINAAGGVLGKDACVNLVDSSETSQAAVSIANIKKQLQSKVSAIVGPESSGVTYNVLPTIKGAKTVLFSNAATDDGLTGVSPYFFRNPAPNGFEASALGSQIVADGRSKVAFLTFNDPYGTNLRDGMEKVVADSGSAKVVYGGKGKNQEFPSTETNFGSDVSAALATKPDAIVIIAFDQTKQIIQALVSSGWKMANTYFVDGNLNDYSADLPDGTLTGAKGATQGVNPSPDLRKRIAAAYKANGGSSDITSYGYGAEAYDASTLIALAAEKGKKSDSATIQKNLPAVSGTTGGTVCKSFADCKKLLDAGKEIQYQGLAGTGPFNAKNDISSGYISIYEFDGNAPSKFLTSTKESDS
ncbi:ABC transporter substrate-binding protein [uncultured Amnibacterium sp.]|uniref:ABC transporter substrate-binding protein n=1 Tax=uncultured Amnibacterium sp. TaxID=1631851 RepID=UPI0035CB2CE7